MRARCTRGADTPPQPPCHRDKTPSISTAVWEHSSTHVANHLGMKISFTLTIPRNFFECCTSQGAILSKGRKVVWAKKQFSDIWCNTPLGKPNASAAWKKCLEFLMGGGGWEKCLRGCMQGWRGLVPGKGGGGGVWKKCLDIWMGGGVWEKCLQGCLRGWRVGWAGIGAQKLPWVDAR